MAERKQEREARRGRLQAAAGSYGPKTGVFVNVADIKAALADMTVVESPLIAAAPDLLAACERMLRRFSAHKQYPSRNCPAELADLNTIDDARAAIAKATP